MKNKLISKAKTELVRGMIYGTNESESVYGEEIGYRIPMLTHDITSEYAQFDKDELAFTIGDNVTMGVAGAIMGCYTDKEKGIIHNSRMVISKDIIAPELVDELSKIDLAPHMLKGMFKSFDDKYAIINDGHTPTHHLESGGNIITEEEEDELETISGNELATVLEDKFNIDADKAIKAMIDGGVLSVKE